MKMAKTAAQRGPRHHKMHLRTHLFMNIWVLLFFYFFDQHRFRIIWLVLANVLYRVQIPWRYDPLTVMTYDLIKL